MTLESWDWFVDLAEKGSFRKAAENTSVSQQTLSARLASLEKDVGAKLVERGVPLSLTPAGMAFLLYAREQQQAQHDLLRQIGEATGSGRGVLKVGVSPVRARILMPRVASILTREFPLLNVQLVEGTNRELTRMAERGEADAVIARFESTHPGVDVMPLYEEEVVLVVRGDLLESVMGIPATQAANILAEQGIGALENCPFVLGKVDDVAGRIAYSELRNAGIKAHVAATSESIDTLLALAAAGVGAAFAPRIALARANHDLNAASADGAGDTGAGDVGNASNAGTAGGGVSAGGTSNTGGTGGVSSSTCPSGIHDANSTGNIGNGAKASLTRSDNPLMCIPLSSQATYTIELGIPMQQEPWQVRDLLKNALLEEARRINR